MSYKFKTEEKGNNHEVELKEDLTNLVEQAKTDFKTSNDYISNYERDIWRWAYKSYHLSTFDRKVQLWSRTWKQNITIGLVRSFVDVLKSTVKEKPLSFYGTWINKLWIQNKEYILKTLNYISDVTWFHTQLKKTMWDGLLTWEICLRVWYLKSKKEESIVSIVNWTSIEETYIPEEKNYPYATNISIFNVFPDPYSWPLRYVTERWVIPYENFIDTFWHLIRYKKNNSPFKWDEFLKTLPINPNGADFTDYGNIVNQIHNKINEDFRAKDQYTKSTTQQSTATNGGVNFDEDTTLTKWLIEFKITWYKTRIVLLANNYPVYIWENIYWFIPYVIKASNETDTRFWEGIPYLLKWLEEVWNSFINNYFDSARSIANPTIVANKNLLINDEQLEDWTPGWVLYTESTDWGNAVYRLDKWWLNDFNIMSIIQQIATQITWISEYNLGQSRWERTATGALSVSQSSNKRMSPYISNFLDAISVVAWMWLELCKRFWVQEQYIYVLDEDGKQIEELISNKNLTGGVNISLRAEGMFGSVNELELQKLISIYQTLSPSWFITSPEIAKEIIKKAGFEPSRFIIEEKVTQAKPDNYQDINNPNTPLENPDASLWEIIQQWVNPQENLGNWGKWQG